ncbi:MAG: hypothetical protein WBA12_10655 [Catalinimonas sp.]
MPTLLPFHNKDASLERIYCDVIDPNRQRLQSLLNRHQLSAEEYEQLPPASLRDWQQMNELNASAYQRILRILELDV